MRSDGLLRDSGAGDSQTMHSLGGQIGGTGGGGARPVPAAGGPDPPLHPPRPYLPLVLGQAGGFEEEGEEKEEEDKEKAGVPVQLLLMTSYDSLFPTCTDEKHCRQGKPLQQQLFFQNN